MSRKPRYIQRDLEDQIREEKSRSNERIKCSFNQFSNQSLKTKSMSTTQTAPATAEGNAPKKEVSLSEVLGLLAKGYTRRAKADKGFGSIEAHFGLTASQVKELFNHPKLKGRKAKLVSLSIKDDAPDAPEAHFKSRKPKAAATANEALAGAVSPAPATAATDNDLFR
jgi:hypothetical protein